MVMEFFLYILYSEELDKYYTGVTQEISARLKEHLWNHKGYTAKAKDWRVVYHESFSTKEEALKRENQIKKWKSRKMIEKLISSEE